MSGPFDEKLVVENVHDPSNNQTIRIKAHVRSPSAFYVTSLQIDFGMCQLDERSRAPEKIVLVNSSKQRRVFEVIADTSSFDMCVPTLAFQYVSSSFYFLCVVVSGCNLFIIYAYK